MSQLRNMVNLWDMGFKDVNSACLNCTVLVAVVYSNPVFKHGLN